MRITAIIFFIFATAILAEKKPYKCTYLKFVQSLTVALLFVSLLTKGSKTKISTTRLGLRWKMFRKTPPKISRRIVWCNQNFWKWNFQHRNKPEIDRKWPYTIDQLTFWSIVNIHMLLLEFLCHWYSIWNFFAVDYKQFTVYCILKRLKLNREKIWFSNNFDWIQIENKR